MAHHAVKFEYPHAEIPLILRSSYEEDAYYGVDELERKRMKIIMTKFGCRHSFHNLPGRVTANLHPFTWDRLRQCFRIRMEKKIEVHLNTLEEMVVNHPVFEAQ